MRRPSITGLRESLVRLAAVFRKEVTQTVRDKRVLGVLIVAPLFQLLVLGFAVDLTVDRVPVAVVDHDRTDQSRRLAAELVAGDMFDLALSTDRPEEAVAQLDTAAVGAVLVIPRGYAADLAAGRSVALQALVDGSDANRANLSRSALGGFAVRQGLALAPARLGAMRAAQASVAGAGATTSALVLTRVEPRVLYNPRMLSAVYYVPGIAATLLLIVTVIVTAMGLAREKETGTLEQILVTPISPSTLILGKVLPYGLIGLFDELLVLTAAVWIFKVPLVGHPGLLFLGGAFYLMTTLGVGLLLSTVARTQQQAFMSALFFMLPAIILSGFLTPVSNMPEALQVVSAFDPVRHFVELLRAVMLRGADARDVAPQLVALAGTGLCVLIAAVTALRRRLT